MKNAQHCLQKSTESSQSHQNSVNLSNVSETNDPKKFPPIIHMNELDKDEEKKILAYLWTRNRNVDWRTIIKDSREKKHELKKFIGRCVSGYWEIHDHISKKNENYRGIVSSMANCTDLRMILNTYYTSDRKSIKVLIPTMDSKSEYHQSLIDTFDILDCLCEEIQRLNKFTESSIECVRTFDFAQSDSTQEDCIQLKTVEWRAIYEHDTFSRVICSLKYSTTTLIQIF